ncbi:hypothetical protein [Rhizobium rhizogenes]|uniref:hypothetical protein n=1 Tax=Rhizobium rhizogenes TaxID=359 RepID=UPI000AFB2932|nr:hypothetical protein [Rhizobium rhizogenes]
MDIHQFRNAARRSSSLSANEHYELWAILAIESFERELEAFYRRAQFVIVPLENERYARD